MSKDKKEEALIKRLLAINLPLKVIQVVICQFPCSHNCETRIFFSQNIPENIDSSPRRLSVDRRWNYWLDSQSNRVPDVCPLTVPETIWLESQLYILRPTQKLLTHIPAVCTSTVATTNESRPRRLSSDRYRK